MSQRRDKFGRVWNLPECELCPECGQPDSTGDCNHKRISTAQYKQLVNQRWDKRRRQDMEEEEQYA